MRLVIVGGGGFRVPLVYQAVARARNRVPLTEVVLNDSDPVRLAAMSRVLKDLGESLPVSTTTDLDEALTGAHIIFSAIRVGGTHGRVIDEQVALKHGLLGQETIGVGGLAFAIRTVGVMEHLARRAAEIAPAAWIINFTNPAGLITEAMLSYNPRVVGICDTPIALVRRVARVLGVNEADAEIGYLGINHLGWLHAFEIDGENLLAGLLADPALLTQIEEARILGPEWVQTLGAIPNEYLFYYSLTREAIASITGAPITRGEFLQEQQEAFYQQVNAHPTLARELWEGALAEREATYMAEARDRDRDDEDLGGGYHHVAVDLMAALLGDEQRTAILNVANNGVIPGLPDDAVVEIPCLTNNEGVHNLPAIVQLALDETALISRVKASDRALIDAVRAGSKSLAWRAFGAHPLVDSVAVAKNVLNEYIEAQEFIAQALPNA